MNSPPSRKIEKKSLKLFEIALKADYWLDDYPIYTGLSVTNPTPLWFRRMGPKLHRKKLYRRLKRLGLFGRRK